MNLIKILPKHGSHSARGLLRVAVAFAVLLSATQNMSCTYGGKDSGGWEPSKLGRLALRLESKYKRELQLNPYSLHYTSVTPNTIIIKVQYQPTANLNLVYSVVDEATKLVHKLAADEFDLFNIRVQTDIKPIKK